jgi:hypothetical protein
MPPALRLPASEQEVPELDAAVVRAQVRDAWPEQQMKDEVPVELGRSN